MIPPMEDYNKLLEIHQSFARNVDNLSDFAIKLQDDSYEVGRQRGWIEAQAMRDELLSALRLIEHATSPDHNDGAYHENAHELAQAAILKHTEKQA